jgi:hypothetical protein
LAVLFESGNWNCGNGAITSYLLANVGTFKKTPQEFQLAGQNEFPKLGRKMVPIFVQHFVNLDRRK